MKLRIKDNLTTQIMGETCDSVPHRNIGGYVPTVP